MLCIESVRFAIYNLSKLLIKSIPQSLLWNGFLNDRRALSIGLSKCRDHSLAGSGNAEACGTRRVPAEIAGPR